MNKAPVAKKVRINVGNKPAYNVEKPESIIDRYYCLDKIIYPHFVLFEACIPSHSYLVEILVCVI